MGEKLNIKHKCGENIQGNILGGFFECPKCGNLEGLEVANLLVWELKTWQEKAEALEKQIAELQARVEKAIQKYKDPMDGEFTSADMGMKAIAMFDILRGEEEKESGK